MCGSTDLRPRSSPPPAATAAPRIAQLNVSDHSRMHIGPSFVSVTQTVHATEVVEDVGLVRYLWEWVQRTSRAERLACAAALAALALCAALLAMFTAPRALLHDPDVSPHSWNITREMWLAEPARGDQRPWQASFLPLRLVVVQHTVGPECYRFADCVTVMHNLQNDYFKKKNYDIPYNFVVGNDGRVYEGHGWRTVGAHTFTYNSCALGLGFTGDYRPEGGGTRPTPEQLNHTRALLAGGVRAGLLHERYRVLAACDVQPTESPGTNLYRALQAWPQFVNASEAAEQYRGVPCAHIYKDAANGSAYP